MGRSLSSLADENAQFARLKLYGTIVAVEVDHKPARAAPAQSRRPRRRRISARRGRRRPAPRRAVAAVRCCPSPGRGLPASRRRSRGAGSRSHALQAAAAGAFRSVHCGQARASVVGAAVAVAAATAAGRSTQVMAPDGCTAYGCRAPPPSGATRKANLPPRGPSRVAARRPHLARVRVCAPPGGRGGAREVYGG